MFAIITINDKQKGYFAILNRNTINDHFERMLLNTAKVIQSQNNNLDPKSLHTENMLLLKFVFH